MMIRGSVTSAALPPHELKQLPNYAHLYNLSPEEDHAVEDNITLAPINPTVRTKKDKKSRWSNQPAQKVEVVVLEEENWDDVDIDEAESPKKSKEISTESKANKEDNCDGENATEEIQKEGDKKSCSETSEQKDSWDEDDKPSAHDNDKSQDSGNQGPKKIDADFLGQQIAVQIEKIRHRQAILVQQHLNTQVLIANPPLAPQSPPIVIEKLGAAIIDDIYDVSMPPPLIISADAIISSDVSPIDTVILAQAIQITNKKRGFESIALAPVIHQKLAVVTAPPEVIDLVDAPEVSVNSREGIEVLRPTYGLLRKTVQVKPIKQKSKLDENWDDDDEESNPPKKVDFKTLSSALKCDDLLQAVSDEENWEDDQDENLICEDKKYKKTRESRNNDNWDDEESNEVYQQVDPDILERHMAEFAAGSSKRRKSNTSVETKSSHAIIDEDENWDDDPELEAASKKLIDPEILVKNVPLHNSMDSEAISAKSNKIVPLENTSESFRKEFVGSTKNREKNNIMKALSSLPSSVASMPVSAAVAAYAVQKKKLNEQSYDYQPRREWKHSDPYSYPLADYIVPVDYGRVPQSHPIHYGTKYDYNAYYKSNYSVPTKDKLSPVTVKPTVKQLKSKSPVNKTKSIVQVQKKKKLDLNAEDLSDGEIVDSEEDFGNMSDINSANEDDDVIEIPAKVDLVDLTEEEMAAAVKIESVTVDIKKERAFNPPIPAEKVQIPKPPEFEDSPESPVNKEVNEDPEEWHEEMNPQDDSPASPENMDVTEEHKNSQNKVEDETFKNNRESSSASPVNTETVTEVPIESTVESFQKYHESPASPINTETSTKQSITPKDDTHSEETYKDNENEDSPASPVTTETATEVSNAAEGSIVSKDNKIEDSPASPVNDEESEVTTDVPQIESVQEIQLSDSLEENDIDSEETYKDNENEDSPASPVTTETATEVSNAAEGSIVSKDNKIEDSPASPVNDEESEVTTDVPQIESVQEIQLSDSLNAPENDIDSEDNEVEKLPSSVNNEHRYRENNGASLVSISNEHNIVMKELREETGLLQKITNVKSDSSEKECSEKSPRTLEENSEEEKAERSPSSSLTNDSSRNEVHPEKNHGEQIHSFSLDPVEVFDKNLPEQVEITSNLIDTSLKTKELVTIDLTEIPVDEISLENHEKEEKSTIDTQETEDCNQEPYKVVESALESDSEMDDDDILLDDSELEAAALFLSNETVEVTEATATSSTNETQETSVGVTVEKSTVVLNASSIENDARFNPYILIKKGM